MKDNGANPTKDTIQILINECSKELTQINAYRAHVAEDDYEDLLKMLDGVIGKIMAMKTKWEDVLASEEEITPSVSYNASYAFVELSKHIEELKFGLERFRKVEEYLEFSGE